MFGQSDVVQPAVVAQGYDTAGVDFVVPDAEVRGDFVAGWEGFERGQTCSWDDQLMVWVIGCIPESERSLTVL